MTAVPSRYRYTYCETLVIDDVRSQTSELRRDHRVSEPVVVGRFQGRCIGSSRVETGNLLAVFALCAAADFGEQQGIGSGRDQRIDR